LALRRTGIITTAALAALGASTIALAAEPAPGGSFRGELAAPRDEVKVSFKVSRSGARVTRIRLSDMPSYCRQGGRPKPIRFKRARISRMDTFKSSRVKRFTSGPRRGQMQVRVTISGRFISEDVVRGRVTTNWTAAADPDLCDGGDDFMAGMPR
jgi:hypothetical protein